MYKHLILSLCFIITACLCGACTDAELCYDIEHPHKGNARFAFNWSTGNSQGNNVPDSMFVIADRIFNSWKCGLKADSKTGEGRYLINEPETKVEGESDNATAEATKDFRLRTGTYKMVTFNMDDTELDYSDVYTYMNDRKNEFKLQDIYVKYKSYHKNDPALRKPTEVWVDYNPYSQYIQAEMPAVFFDTLESVGVIHNKDILCSFTPEPLTQDIEISFRIQKLGTTPFIVDSVIAEMSGIPHKVNLSNGYIDITKTYKMMFKLNMEDTNGTPFEDDNTARKQLVCRKSINVTTIVGSNSGSMTSGPGIMQVLIFATAIDNSTGTEFKVKKKIQGKINLCNTINAANLIEHTDDGQHARRRGSKGKLQIGTPLRIDGKTITEEEEDNSIDQWKTCSGIIVDI